MAGGAVLARNIGNIIWNATTLRANHAELGGGLMMTNGASISIQGVSFADDEETGTVFIPPGGGTRSVFERNTAIEGGGLMCFGCSKLDVGRKLGLLKC